MERRKIWGPLVLLAVCVICNSCMETRQQSIIRENGYLEKHQVEKVARYWDQVTYAVVDGTTLTMDISSPEGQGPFPCVIIIHGGGWTMHTNTIMEGMARYITNRGYVVFNINYRVLPEVKMEQIVEDCLGALLWVKEHAAEYGGDPKRLAVTGDSAGGHLTAMLVTQARNPAFVPSYQPKGTPDFSISCAAPSYGVYNFLSLSKLVPSITKGFLGESCGKNPERCKLLSPRFSIKSGLPPQLVMVGDLDPLYLENYRYVKALRKAGDPVEFWVYHGKSHAFLNNFWDKTGTRGYDRMLEFFDQNLKK